jgi:hypothetical protein
MNTLQIKLARLESQLKITKGNRAKAKIVIEILKVESAIEQLKPKKEIKVKDITIKIPVSVSTLKKHCKVPSSKLTDKEIIDGWKYSLAAQSMQRDFRTQKDIQWGDRHLLLQVVYWVDQYQQEMNKRGLTEKYCLWIEEKQAFKDEFHRKPEKAINESKPQINIAETQVIELRAKQLELNLFCEMPCVNKFQEVIDNTKFTKQTISILNKEGKTRKVKGEALGDYLISAGENDAYSIHHIPTGLEIMSSVGFKTRNPVKYENLSEKEAAKLAVKKLVAANIDIPGSYLEWNKSSAIEKAKIGQNIIDAFDDKIKAKAS